MLDAYTNQYSQFIGLKNRWIGSVFVLMGEAIDSYMVNCHSRKLREKTMNSYEQTLRLFERWLSEKGYSEQVKDIKDHTIREYIIDIQERGKYSMYTDQFSREAKSAVRRRDYRTPVSTITVNNYLRNLKAFFNWLDDMDFVKQTPMRKIKELPAERKPRQFITDEQIIRLMRSFDKSYFSEYRDYAIVMLLLDTGMRLGECLCQTIDNIDIVKQCVYLDADITKGRKSRTVFFSSKTAKEVRKWLQFKDRYCESDYLFPSKATKVPMDIRVFEGGFRKYLKRAGLPEGISPHNLRNNFAKRCLVAGMDIYTLSRILGHSSVTVTEKAYLDIDDDDLRRKYAGFSPVDNLF